MFRFSRDKRYFRHISFLEFAETAKKLAELTKSSRPNANVEMLTCEDMNTHQYSHVTFMADEVTEARKGRKSYPLEGEFTKEVWERSMSVQLTLKDDADPEPFMICLSCDKQDKPRSMQFYGQCVEQELFDRIYETFSHPSFFYAIGDGYSKPSAFNLKFGKKLTGIRLP